MVHYYHMLDRRVEQYSSDLSLLVYVALKLGCHHFREVLLAMQMPKGKKKALKGVKFLSMSHFTIARPYF